MASKDHGWSHTHTHTHTAAAVQEGGWGWEGGCGVERCMGDCGFVVQEPHASGLLNIFDQLTQKACAYSLTFGSTAKKTKYYLLDWLRIEPHCFFWYKLKCVSSTECYLVSFILVFQIIPDLKLYCQSQSQTKLMLCSQTSNPQDAVFKASPKVPYMVYVS